MSIKTRKIGILGAGNVGAHMGLQLVVQGIADEIVFYDIAKEKTDGEIRDILDCVSYYPHHVEVYQGTVDDMKDADIIINTVGGSMKLTNDRLVLLENTIKINKQLVPLIEKSGFDGIIMSITNPCDVVVQYLQYKLDWPKNKIFGSGTALDSARLQLMLCQQLKINRNSINAYLLGEHGNSAMIPWSHVSVAGKPIDELLREQSDRYKIEPKDVILQKVKNQGYIENSSKGCTEYGVTASTSELVRAVLHNEHKVIPCAVYLDGQYGVHDVYTSVPAIIGKDGVEGIIEINLTDDERKEFLASVDVLKSYFKKALKV